MRAKMILICLGLVVMTLSFVGNANAVRPGEEMKGPAVLHSIAGGDSLMRDATGLVCTWWRQLWYCGNLYHIEQYHDTDGDGVISYCDKCSLSLHEAYGQPVTNTNWGWVHIRKVAITLKLKKIAPVCPDTLDTMFVEFPGGGLDSLGYDLPDDSITRALTNPVCTWWHEVWPWHCRYYHLSSFKDGQLPGEPGYDSLSTCDTLDLTEYWHVISVTEGVDSLWLTLGYPEGSGVENRILTFSGGVDPDSVARALFEPVCTWWHEEHPDTCKWWHIDSWEDNGNGYLDSCDIIDFITWWHVEDVAIDIVVHKSGPPEIPTTTQWGVIILVALLIVSAIYIMLRRRKAAVPA